MSLPPKIIVAPPGRRSRDLSARLSAAECPAFDARRDAREETSGAPQSPVVYERGESANVWDVDGNRYVDLVAGFGALIFGHAPRAIEKIATEQEAKLGLALGDVYASEVKVELCEKLASLFPEPGARVMLGLSGADALTAALKTVALSGKSRVVAFEGSYHGLSYGPLAACGLSSNFRAPFRDQIGDWVTFEPYPATPDIARDVLARLRALAKSEGGKAVGAVLIEPVLGRGGVVEVARDFLRDLRSICDDAGWMLVVDEVFTGCGRSGAFSRAVAEGVLPDILCLGKGLGAGRPISAMIGRAHMMAAWGAHRGTTIHTATHFGSPPSCVAALAVLRALDDGSVYASVARKGASFRDALIAACAHRAVVRQRGLMLAIDLGTSARALSASRALLERGYIVITGGARGESITLTPPFDIREELLAGFATTFDEVLETLDERGAKARA